MLKIIEKITGKKTRVPSNRAQLIALPQAVMIYTEEGSIVATPQLARNIAENLTKMADEAERFSGKENRKNPTE